MQLELNAAQLNILAAALQTAKASIDSLVTDIQRQLQAAPPPPPPADIPPQ